MNLRLRYATLALVVATAACSKTDQTVNTTENTVTEISSDVGNAATNATDSVGNALNPVPSGQDFTNTAAKSDAFEIAAAKLAKTKSKSADVLAFADKMITAHTASTAKIKAAAGKASPAIVPDATLTPDQQSKLADLAKLTGADFDTAYASGQVAAHEEALTLMKNYADQGTVPTLKTAAGEIAPDVQMHLDMAKALKK